MTPAPSTDRMPWVSMGAVLFGTFMVALDQTIVTIALPQIGGESSTPSTGSTS